MGTVVFTRGRAGLALWAGRAGHQKGHRWNWRRSFRDAAIRGSAFATNAPAWPGRGTHQNPELGQIGAEATDASGEPPEPHRVLQFNIASGGGSVNGAEVQCSARATAPQNASKPLLARFQRVKPQGK